jgi:hypothetical protein
MQHYYKHHPIHGFAVAESGMLWHSRGLVFDPKRPRREVKRLECSEIISTSREEAEEYALILCRAWIDGLKAESKNRSS